MVYLLGIPGCKESVRKFPNRGPLPVRCPEYEVVTVQILGSHAAIFDIAVLDKGVKVVHSVQIEETCRLLLHIHDRDSQDLAQSWIHIHAVRQEKCSLLDMTSIDINNIRTGRPCPVLGFHDQIASLALYCGADTDLLV